MIARPDPHLLIFWFCKLLRTVMLLTVAVIPLAGYTADRDSPLSQEEAKVALPLYKVAAEQGDPTAQLQLGVLYERLHQNALAKSWYAKSAAQGNAEAQFYYAESIRGNAQAGSYSTELKKAADMGSPDAQYAYAIYALQLKIIDHKEQFDWLLKAAKGGQSKAAFDVAVTYEHGKRVINGQDPIVVTPDLSEALKWYLESARAGDGYSMRHVAQMYDWGIGTARDEKKAFEWYLKAATSGYLVAADRLAEMYLKGIGITPDPHSANEWREKYLNWRLENEKPVR